MKYWYVDVSLIVLGLAAIALVHVLRWNESVTLQSAASPLRADAATYGVRAPAAEANPRDAADCRVTDGQRSYTLERATASPACDTSRVSPPHP